VWIATGIALTINLFLFQKASFHRSSQSYAFLIITPLVGIFLLLTFLVSTAPDFIEKLSERANDIVNYKTEGTGNWRHEQFVSYLPFIKENFFMGMRFEGFELPIQFYNLEAGIPFFNDGTGHHFHSFYVDTLFYFGVVGLLLKIAPFFYLAYKIYKERELTIAQLALSAFAFSALFYGISYWWPAFFYGIFGFTISIFDNKAGKVEEPTEEVPQSFSIPYSLKKEYI
jgi:O-antigen ligase